MHPFNTCFKKVLKRKIIIIASWNVIIGIIWTYMYIFNNSVQSVNAAATATLVAITLIWISYYWLDSEYILVRAMKTGVWFLTLIITLILILKLYCCLYTMQPMARQMLWTIIRCIRSSRSIKIIISMATNVFKSIKDSGAFIWNKYSISK